MPLGLNQFTLSRNIFRDPKTFWHTYRSKLKGPLMHEYKFSFNINLNMVSLLDGLDGKACTFKNLKAKTIAIYHTLRYRWV